MWYRYSKEKLKDNKMDDLSAGRLENIPDDYFVCDNKSPLARNGHFDAIVHLAAQTMVPASMEDRKIWKII